MTACGVGTLLVGRYVILGRRAPGSKDAAAKAVDLAPVEKSIFDGMAWLDKTWSSFSNPPAHKRPTCYLYCVERAMDLLGGSRIGEHSWYVEMAEALLARQEEDGRWDVGGSWADHASTYDTCFALLFLSRATLGVLRETTPSGD
jgi:hypothetical protein